MKKKWIFNLGIATAGVAAIATTTTSCGGGSLMAAPGKLAETKFGVLSENAKALDQSIRIGVVFPKDLQDQSQIVGWNRDLNDDKYKKEFASEIASEYNKAIKKDDLKDCTVSFKVLENVSQLITSIDEGALTAGIVSSYDSLKYYTHKDGIVPVAAATRKTYNYDPVDANGIGSGKPESVLNAINLALRADPSNPSDTLQSRIQGIVASGKPSTANRAAIYITGTQDQINSIRLAWVNKDWKAFLSHGIETGPSTSQLGYQIQEKMLENHFGKNFKGLDYFGYKGSIHQSADAASDYRDDNSHIILSYDGDMFDWVASHPQSTGDRWMNYANTEYLDVSYSLVNNLVIARGGIYKGEAAAIATAFNTEAGKKVGQTDSIWQQIYGSDSYQALQPQNLASLVDNITNSIKRYKL